MKISAILPSLNVKEYITQCLESVMAQTLSDIEIICVDAGSTDGTLEIIKDYAKKDDRIILIESERKSYGLQMNMGMERAGGEYIAIVETDDYILENMFEELYQIAECNSADFVKADFYRFSCEAGNVKKARICLSEQADIYNRVIDISKEQGCFDLVMNTWCGIYRRSFIENNKIRHNETPGASYQDNGFWFQTFMNAHRAYFVNRPYYMNRRDNQNSSVYSKDKVYCICDEYKFIYNLMDKSEQLKNFGYAFAKACYRAYKANYSRISIKYKRDFMERWVKDFEVLDRKHLLQKDYFDENDWKALCDMLDDPASYCEGINKKHVELIQKTSLYNYIIIYGAGMIGRQVYDELYEAEEASRVLCFAVTDMNDNISNYRDIPIYVIDQLDNYKENACVIVATTEKYQDEITDKLHEIGFRNIYTY